MRGDKARNISVCHVGVWARRVHICESTVHGVLSGTTRGRHEEEEKEAFHRHAKRTQDTCGSRDAHTYSVYFKIMHDRKATCVGFITIYILIRVLHTFPKCSTDIMKAVHRFGGCLGSFFVCVCACVQTCMGQRGVSNLLSHFLFCDVLRHLENLG